jgi:hypothetical protein
MAPPLESPLRWYRSWPEAPPPGRAFVHDGVPRLLMTGCDYQTLTRFQPWPPHRPGFCLLEWDVALDRVGRARFAEEALAEPDRILVAPYHIYPVGGRPTIVHKHGPGRSRVPIARPRPTADSFGFGCIYMPQLVLQRFLITRPRAPMRDSLFSDWHMDRYPPVRVTWDVHPQHLHGD